MSVRAVSRIKRELHVFTVRRLEPFGTDNENASAGDCHRSSESDQERQLNGIDLVSGASQGIYRRLQHTHLINSCQVFSIHVLMEVRLPSRQPQSQDHSPLQSQRPRSSPRYTHRSIQLLCFQSILYLLANLIQFFPPGLLKITRREFKPEAIARAAG